MKKTMVITSLTLAVILLGIFGGIAAAQGQGQDKIIRGSSMLTSRMAEILGIEEDRVEQAFKQAASETRDERMRNYLARLVEAGKITQGPGRPQIRIDEGKTPGSGRSIPPLAIHMTSTATIGVPITAQTGRDNGNSICKGHRWRCAVALFYSCVLIMGC